MVPVALATSGGAEWRNALGALLIGGLTSSTILTLVVIPAVFMIPSDVERFARDFKRWSLTLYAPLKGHDVTKRTKSFTKGGG